MKTEIRNSIMTMSVVPASAGSDHDLSYLIGGIIALLIMGYLVYVLLHPDKF